MAAQVAAGCRHNLGYRKPTAIIAQTSFLELYYERHCATNVGHLVIENALVGLICRQRADGAYCKIFIHAIVCGQRKNFVDVIATSLPILSHHDSTNSVDEERTRHNQRVTQVCAV